jgi:hypothetical protein
LRPSSRTRGRRLQTPASHDGGNGGRSAAGHGHVGMAKQRSERRALSTAGGVGAAADQGRAPVTSKSVGTPSTPTSSSFTRNQTTVIGWECRFGGSPFGANEGSLAELHYMVEGVRTRRRATDAWRGPARRLTTVVRRRPSSRSTDIRSRACTRTGPGRQQKTITFGQAVQ